LNFPHPRLKREQKGQLLEQLFDLQSSFPEQEILELRAQPIINKDLRTEFPSSQNLFVEVAHEVDYSFQFELIFVSLFEGD
jgi:hypothetical protein